MILLLVCVVALLLTRESVPNAPTLCAAQHTTALAGIAHIENITLDNAGLHQLLFSAFAAGMPMLATVEKTVNVLPGRPSIESTNVDCPTLHVGRAANCSLVVQDACGNAIPVKPCVSSPHSCVRPVSSSEVKLAQLPLSRLAVSIPLALPSFLLPSRPPLRFPLLPRQLCLGASMNGRDFTKTWTVYLSGVVYRYPHQLSRCCWRN